MAHGGATDKIKGESKVPGLKRDQCINLQSRKWFVTLFFSPLLWKEGGRRCERSKQVVWRNQLPWLASVWVRLGHGKGVMSLRAKSEAGSEQAASAEILRWRWRLDGKPSQPSLARGKDNLQRGKGSEQKWNKACWRIECNLAKKGLAFVTFSLREQRLHVWESVQDCKLKKGKKTYQQECWIEIKSKHPYRSLENQRLPVITSLRPQIAASQSVKKKHINLKISLHVNSRSMMIYWWYRVRSLDLKSSAWAVIQE